MLLEATALTKSFGESLLFKGADFKIEQNDKIGLIGANGCGKTTLFKIICGEEECDSGGVVRKSGLKVGQLRQHACADSDRSTYDETLSVFSDLLAAETELEKVNLMLETSSDVALIERQHELHEKYERDGGLTFRARTRSALSGLGFSEQQQNLSIRQLSGGQKSKVELCKLLLSSPELMLLDEPTNHLDIDAIEWLDGYISSYKGAVVIISHDRYFLDRVVGKIFEIAYERLTCYDGNYTKFCRVKEERAETVRRNYENTMREVKRIEAIIEQQKTWSMERNYKIIETKQKQIDRLMDGLVKPENDEDKMRLSFSCKQESGNEVLNAENLTVIYDDKTLYNNIELKIRKHENVFLLGPNGCGKTTLLRQLQTDRVNVRPGSGVSIGYFDQHGSNLDLNKSPFDQLRADYPDMTDTEIRNALAAFLFKGDEVFRKISELSGGERAKVALCRLTLAHDNLLLLDEPTNHLDLDSREQLEKALEKYDGTMLVVSHDRYFINRLATCVLRFKDGSLEKIEGNYDKYIEIKTAEQAAANPEEKQTAMGSGKQQYLQKKQLESTLRKLTTQLKRCEETIAELEAEADAANNELNSPECISDYAKTLELSEKTAELQLRLDEQLEIWEQLSGELEALKS